MATLYLIRHGATRQNECRPIVLQGCGIDGPLSEKGQIQADAVARVLARKPLSQVFTSPMLRARQTAETIAGPHGLEIKTIPQLHEIDVGAWEGMSWTQIMERHPEEYARFMADSGVTPYRDGESYSDVLRRAKPVIRELLSQHQGESIAVVAHSVVNRTLLADLLKVPLQHARLIHQSNCCINVIRGTVSLTELVTMNAEIDLFDDLPSEL